MRALVVEDDVKLGRALQRALGLEAYVVDLAERGDEALRQAAPGHYDVIVLDVVLPGMDGFAVCEALRRQDCWTPVLLLTGRAGVADRIRGLDGGADDYLVKPFDLGELLARVHVLTRRGLRGQVRLLSVGDLRVDAATHLVTRGGQHVKLTAREFDVLEVLARNPDRVVTRTALLAAVWQADYQCSANIVDVYIGYLRRKLGAFDGPSRIRTVRGEGFVLGSS